MKTQRITVRYEGRVQGVGFRFTVINLSRNFEVTGFVRNEFDGSVTLAAEGEEGQLMGLLQAVRNSSLAEYITKEQASRSSATGEFESFTIGY